MARTREAIVLAGGFGTRLAHVVPDVCKPMAPVAGRPFLRYIMDQLDSAHFDRAVVADGYRREQIEDFFGSAYRGLQVGYSPEDEPLFTGGAVKQALAKCHNDWVFVLNGDTWLDIDFAAMEAAAAEAPASVQAVVAVKRMYDFERYGTVDVDAGGLITGFHEKRPCADGLINAGAYLIRREALDAMPEKFSLESDFFEKVVADGALAACECDGGFIDIGVPEDYELAQTMLAPLAKRWKLAMFDRDGTINVDTGHLHEIEKLELFPETVQEMARYAADPEYKVVVVTNQAGIAKGLYSEADMRALHRYMEDELEKLGALVDAWYFCPHHPDFTGECGCRKPAPGMLLASMRDFDADAADCIMYGDKPSDQAAAKAAGVKFNLAGGGKCLVGAVTDNKRYDFLGMPVDALTREEALARVAELVRMPEPSHVLFLNVDVMVKADKSPALKNAIVHSDISLMDGKPPLKVARKRGIPLPEKVSGSDFVPDVCAMAEQEGFSVFILGGKEGVPEAARGNLLAKHPGLNVAGAYSPKFGFEKDPAELTKINTMLIEAKPDILLACLSCPKQEIFVEGNKDVYKAPVSISCGATVDFLAGNVQRAPEWVSHSGLEWLYRFAKEPKRLFKRYFVDSWHFLAMLGRRG